MGKDYIADSKMLYTTQYVSPLNKSTIVGLEGSLTGNVTERKFIYEDGKFYTVLPIVGKVLADPPKHWRYE